MTFLAVRTIYEHPTDYPDDYVARKSFVQDGAIKQTEEVFIEKTLEEVRSKLPSNLNKIARAPEDEPQIVECWL
ncbi:hypothetical protein R6242_16135 [Iodobacter sp. CM08]|uniref:hypothetical protein n=1 Tax=Iodobacter sp. CM08 TaxID=3085902 RepID=UPI0029823B90|nr:hypothetical protein [Iodobacter sp. CM08]MDW5418096.1 hypothetical protein [Iodobacter sp. CM08]